MSNYIFNEEWLSKCCLDLLRKRRSSSGDLTRRLMGLRILPKDEQSYGDVRTVLASLLAAGKVAKAGNGKAVHWRAND